METDAEAIGQRAAQAGIAALTSLSPRDRSAVVRQVARLMALETKHKAIVADILDRLAMAARDSPNTDSAARVVTALEHGLAVMRDREGEP